MDILDNTFNKHLKLLREHLSLNEEVTDGWFDNDAFEAYKKPKEEKYEIASEDGEIQTFEGPVKYKAGYYD